MGKVENGQRDRAELVEVQKGLFVIKDLTRNPPEVREKLIKELEELTEELHR